jgi:hypothetical protein
MWLRRPPVVECRDEFTPSQRAARCEWRNLCFALEGLQATELLGTCRDRFAFARTCQVYARQHQWANVEVRRAIAAGDYRFFTVRGVPESVMTEEFARVLLRDWGGAVASKQTRLSKGFLGRFATDIDIFEHVTLCNWAARSGFATRFGKKGDLLSIFAAKYATRIAQAAPLDDGNGLLLIGDMPGRLAAGALAGLHGLLDRTIEPHPSQQAGVTTGDVVLDEPVTPRSDSMNAPVESSQLLSS